MICDSCSSPFDLEIGRGESKRVFCQECRSRPDFRKMRDKNKNLKRSYGINLSDFYKLLNDQSGLCPGCGVSFTAHSDRIILGMSRLREQPVVDHCHTNGHVRGLLCHPCNIAVGLMRDDHRIAERLSTYLKSKE